MNSSKDAIHILRLSALLHIFNMYMLGSINGRAIKHPILSVDISSIQRAQRLLGILCQQKSVYLSVSYLVFFKSSACILYFCATLTFIRLFIMRCRVSCFNLGNG